MKKILTLITMMLAFYSSSQTKLYVHPDAKSNVGETKTLAILPLKTEVKLRPKQLKDFTAEQITEMEHNEGLNIQRSMYSWFFK